MSCSAGLCNLDTSADAVLPGLVQEQKRGNWELGEVSVFDGGQTLFLTQGLFVP